MKISCYGYIFNATKFSFDLNERVENFCSFFDEVVCVTVPSEDNTREILSELEKKFSNLKVIDSSTKIIGNNRFDGQLKTIGMNNCSNEIRVIVDFDEHFPLSQKELWHKYADKLLQNKNLDGYLIPVIDLWGSKDLIRADQNIGQKFRMHKSTVHSRGVISSAERGGGLIDVKSSDSTEPCSITGELCKFETIVQRNLHLMPIMSHCLNAYPFVLHYGFLNFGRRATINKKFWKDRWEERSGGPLNDIVTNILELESIPTINHNINLE